MDSERAGRIVVYALGCFSAVVVAVAMLGLVVANRNLSDTLECRFEVSAEVNDIGDRIDLATARALSALGRQDISETEREQEIITQAREIDRLTNELEPALERRTDAVEDCR